jgi:hypothetical protein
MLDLSSIALMLAQSSTFGKATCPHHTWGCPQTLRADTTNRVRPVFKMLLAKESHAKNGSDSVFECFFPYEKPGSDPFLKCYWQKKAMQKTGLTRFSKNASDLVFECFSRVWASTTPGSDPPKNWGQTRF